MAIDDRPSRTGITRRRRMFSQAADHLSDSTRDILVDGVIGHPAIPSRLRWHLLRLAGLRVKNCYVRPNVHFKTRDVSIGEGTYINYGCFFDGPVSIGRDCAISYEVMFCTISHLIGPPDRRAGPPTDTPIVVGDGAWIGARVTVLPGVVIGRGCVIAAGSVVTADCEENCLYAGVPARRVRELDTTGR